MWNEEARVYKQVMKGNRTRNGLWPRRQGFGISGNWKIRGKCGSPCRHFVLSIMEACTYLLETGVRPRVSRVIMQACQMQ
jgi:hypothetical protein